MKVGIVKVGDAKVTTEHYSDVSKIPFVTAWLVFQNQVTNLFTLGCC